MVGLLEEFKGCERLTSLYGDREPRLRNMQVRVTELVYSLVSRYRVESVLTPSLLNYSPLEVAGLRALVRPKEFLLQEVQSGAHPSMK